MTPRSSACALALIALLASGATLHSQTATWDPGGGGTTDGGGDWLAAGDWWDGVSSNVDWTDGWDAVFGNGGAGGTVNLSGAVSANSVTFNSFTGTYTLSGSTLTTSNITTNAGSGYVRLTGPLDNGGSSLTFDASDGLSITRNDGHIETTGNISGTGGLIKNGNGVLWLQGGTLSYTGNTVVNGGVLRAQTSNYISGLPGNLTLNGGVVEAYWGHTFTRNLGTASGEVQLTGGASGFSQHGGNTLNVNLNGGGNTIIQWGTTTFDPTALVFQSIYSNNGANVIFNNGLDLNGADRTIQVNQGSSFSNVRAEIRGIINNTGGTAAGLTKTGDGILILRPGNGNDYTYDGNMRILGGAVQFGSGFNDTWNAESLPSTANLELNNGIAAGYWVFNRALGTGAGQVQITGGRSGFSFKQGDRPSLTFGSAGTEVTWGSATFNPSVLVLGDSNAGSSATIYFENLLDLNGATRTVETGVAGGNGTTAGSAWGRVVGAGAMFTNDIRDSDAGNTAGLIKTGAGKLGFLGTNTYGGGTTVNEGGIFFDQTAAMPGTGNVSLASGTEIIVTVGGSGWSTGTSGVGTLGGLLTGDGGQGTATVSYGGSNTIGLNIDNTSQTYAGNIGDVSGTTNLAIYSNSNSGTMALSGNNTYSGTTRLEDGTLGINSATAISSGNLIINGGSLDNTSGGAVTLSTNNSVTLNTNLTFVGSNDLNLGTGAVSINNNRNFAVNGSTLTLGGGINQTSGNRNVSKSGGGTLVLGGTSNHTGSTSVNAGTLAVNGTLGNTSAVTVASGATLAGSGSINASVTINDGGAIAAGNSIESLATGNLTMVGAAVFAYEMDNSAAAAAAGDLTAVTGNLSLDAGNTTVLALTELGAGAWTAGDKLTLISYSGTWNGGLFDLSGTTVNDGDTINFSGIDWTFDYDDAVAGDNFTGDLTGSSYVTMTAIPEPSAAILGLIGALALVIRRRR